MSLTQKADLPRWDVMLFPERTPSDFASPSSELLLLLLVEADLAELARLRCAIRRSVLSWGRDGREVERSTCPSAQQKDMMTLYIGSLKLPLGRGLHAERSLLQCSRTASEKCCVHEGKAESGTAPPASVHTITRATLDPCVHQPPACCALQALSARNLTSGCAGHLQASQARLAPLWRLCRRACTCCSPTDTHLHLCASTAAAPVCAHVTWCLKADGLTAIASTPVADRPAGHQHSLNPSGSRCCR